MEIKLFGPTQDHDMIGLLLDFKCAGQEVSRTIYGPVVDREGPPMRTILLGCNALQSVP